MGTPDDDEAPRERALKEAIRRRDIFIATLAHELRQPLSAMFPALEIMRRRVNQQSGERARQVIERQVMQLNRLVDDVLHATRIAEGKIVLEKARIDARTVIDDAVAAVMMVVTERGHALSMTVPDEPLWVNADPARLQQILSNLLTNAAKYTDPGGRIGIEAARQDSQVVLTVRDTGRGIAADLLPHIFDLFVQDSPGAGAGLGIGLNVVRGLVELHGGTVTARSDGPGRGSEFIVSLPAYG